MIRGVVALFAILFTIAGVSLLAVSQVIAWIIVLIMAGLLWALALSE